MENDFIVHPIPPVFDENSKVLILGSFPSVKSRENAFFYGHPQNRFWKVTAAIFNEEVPETNAQKEAFLLKNGIAVWDVIKSCIISGSADSTIKNVTPNDLSKILRVSKIVKIFANGKTAENFYKKYLEEKTGIKAVLLPSTSPANAAWNLEKLIKEWEKIKL